MTRQEANKAYSLLDRADRLWVRFHHRNPADNPMRDRADAVINSIASRLRAAGHHVSA